MSNDMYDMLKGYLLSIDQKIKKYTEEVYKIKVELVNTVKKEELQILKDQVSNNKASEVWKYLAITAISMLISGAVVVWRIGTDRVTTDDVEKIISKASSPWLKDKPYTENRIENIEKDVNKLQAKFDHLNGEFWKKNGQAN